MTMDEPAIPQAPSDPARVLDGLPARAGGPATARRRRSSWASARPSTRSSTRCSRTATACWWACPGWARRCSSTRCPASWACRSGASSSRPTSCPPTSPAPRSWRRTSPAAGAGSCSRRARLHQRAAGGRDQPHAAEDAGGAAGGDAGAHGDGGGQAAPAGGAVPRAGHAEPHRAGGHLPPPGGAARPLPVRAAHRLPQPGRGAPGGGAALVHAHRAACSPCWRAEEVLGLREAVARVPAAPNVVDYAVRLVRATRPEDGSAPDYVKRGVRWGASPRASQHLIVAGRARAACQGRFNVAREDVAALAPWVLRHRIIRSFEAEAEGLQPDDIVPPAARRRAGLSGPCPRPSSRACWAASPGLEWKARYVMEGFLPGVHGSPFHGAERGVPRVPPVPAGRRPAAARLAPLRPERPALRPPLRAGDERALLHPLRLQRLHGLSRPEGLGDEDRSGARWWRWRWAGCCWGRPTPWASWPCRRRRTAAAAAGRRCAACGRRSGRCRARCSSATGPPERGRRAAALGAARAGRAHRAAPEPDPAGLRPARALGGRGAGLRRLRFDGHECVCLQVLDGEEVDFPFTEPAVFEDMETGHRRRVSGARCARPTAAVSRTSWDAGARSCGAWTCRTWSCVRTRTRRCRCGGSSARARREGRR